MVWIFSALKKYVIFFSVEALLCLCFTAWKKLCIDKNKGKMVSLCDKVYQKIQRAWRYQILEEIMLRLKIFFFLRQALFYDLPSIFWVSFI